MSFILSDFLSVCLFLSLSHTQSETTDLLIATPDLLVMQKKSWEMGDEVDPLEVEEEIPEADGVILEEGGSAQSQVSFSLQNVLHFLPQSEGTQVRDDHRL